MIAGVDIGGTYLKLGLVENNVVRSEMKIKASPLSPFLETMQAIQAGITNMLDELGVSKNHVEGIGIGFPGLVDSDRLRVLSVNDKFNDATDFDFQRWAKTTFNCPIAMENDARMALLGEWKFGAGVGVHNICMITLGTGIGTAALIEGKLLKGKHFQAGNLGGHFTVNINGRQCSCGNRGCVEAEASTWALEYCLKSDPRYDDSPINGKPLDFETLFEYAQEGDVLSRDIKEYCLEVWSACVVNLIHAYDPELVIMGGGIMESADEILPYLQQKVDEHAWTPWGKVKIVSSKIPNKSALLGAAYAVENIMNEESF